MVALARKTLQYEWRRFLPATIAVAFAGVLLFVQTALVLGIFATSSVFVSTSTADLWVGYPQTPSVDLGRPVSNVAELRLRMDPEVLQVDSLHWLDASWHAPERAEHIAVVVAGINTASNGLLFARALPIALRTQLAEPDTFVVDTADIAKLGIAKGEFGYIQGRRVKLIGVARGIRSLGAVTVATSATTARMIGRDSSSPYSATYYLARLRDGANPDRVQRRVQSGRRFEVWTAAEFGQRTIRFWLFDTGAGLGFIFAAVLVMLVGAIIAGQALAGAISGSLREFAMLRALGISRTELAKIIIAQASWLGGTGLLLATLVSAVIVAAAHSASVPIAPSTSTAMLCAMGVVVVAWLAGLMSLARLARTDPSELLRV